MIFNKTKLFGWGVSLWVFFIKFSTSMLYVWFFLKL